MRKKSDDQTTDPTLDSTLDSTRDYYDLSPEISDQIAVWPGDVKFSHTPTVEFGQGGNFLLSSIQTTLHLGAHTDAPNHYHSNGQGIETRDLRFYYGDCQVIQVSLAPHQRVLPSHLQKTEIKARRILFRTDSFLEPNHWRTDFNALSPELIDYLGKRDVILVGIDTPSIDLYDDKLLVTHKSIYEHDMAVLEGIVLKHVPEGLYQLVALPLKIRGADASPVRAILIRSKPEV